MERETMFQTQHFRGSVKFGSNWYQYCSGNPVNMVDPTGLFGRDDDGRNGFDSSGLSSGGSGITGTTFISSSSGAPSTGKNVGSNGGIKNTSSNNVNNDTPVSNQSPQLQIVDKLKSEGYNVTSINLHGCNSIILSKEGERDLRVFRGGSIKENVGVYCNDWQDITIAFTNNDAHSDAPGSKDGMIVDDSGKNNSSFTPAADRDGNGKNGGERSDVNDRGGDEYINSSESYTFSHHIVEQVRIYRKAVDPLASDPFGHWWIEIDVNNDGIIDNENDESYGWYINMPFSRKNISRILAGVPGIMNYEGQKHRTDDNNPLTDPHHGDREGVDVYFLFSKTSAENTITAIRDFSILYEGEWSISRSCRTFQKDMLEEFDFLIMEIK